MSALTEEQVQSLNDFARTHPHLARVFDYLASGTKEGLGTALNDGAGGGASSAETRAFAYFIGHVGA